MSREPLSRERIAELWTGRGNVMRPTEFRTLLAAAERVAALEQQIEGLNETGQAALAEANEARIALNKERARVAALEGLLRRAESALAATQFGYSDMCPVCKNVGKHYDDCETMHVLAALRAENGGDEK